MLLSSDDNKDNSGVTALASCVERSVPRHMRSNKGISFLFENKKTENEKLAERKKKCQI